MSQKVSPTTKLSNKNKWKHKQQLTKIKMNKMKMNNKQLDKSKFKINNMIISN